MKAFTCLPVLLLAAAPAFAQPIIATAPRGDIESVVVSVADLNLATNDGQDRLDGRLRAAARTVCDMQPGRGALIHEVATKRCFNSALAQGREAGREMIAAAQSGTVLASASVITLTRR